MSMKNLVLCNQNQYYDKQLPMKATEYGNVTIQMVSILNNDGTHQLLFTIK